MMFLLQLILSLSLVNICLGMENKINEKWIINRITEVTSNPYCQKKEEDLVSGTLKVYYADTKKNGNYQLAAQFVPNNNAASIKFSNFVDNQHYTDSNTLKECLNKKSVQWNLATPLYVLRGGHEQQNKSAEVVKIIRIEKFNEPEELLDIYGEFRVIAGGDNIFLRHLDLSHEYTLYHSENIDSIRQALSSKKPFIIKIKDSRYTDEVGKVLKYTNGSYIHWKGWIPSFDAHCVGMPIDLSKIDKPKEIEIKFDLEKEALYYHNRNKWISRGLMAIIFAAIVYQLKDKIYTIGSLLQ